MGRAKCAPQGEGLCKDTRLGLAQGYVSSCTVTHGNGRGPRRLQGRDFYLRFYFASERGVRTGPLCVAAAGFRQYWPFTLLPRLLRAAVTARPSRSRHAPSLSPHGLDDANFAGSAEASSGCTKRPRWLLFKRGRRQAASLPACCVKRDVYANTTANLAHKDARALDYAGDLLCKHGGCFCGGHNAAVPRFFFFWHT